MPSIYKLYDASSIKSVAKRMQSEHNVSRMQVKRRFLLTKVGPHSHMLSLITLLVGWLIGWLVGWLGMVVGWEGASNQQTDCFKC